MGKVQHRGRVRAMAAAAVVVAVAAVTVGCEAGSHSSKEAAVLGVGPGRGGSAVVGLGGGAPSYNTATTGGARAAIAWAETFEAGGANYAYAHIYEGYCLAFVANAYGSTRMADTAWEEAGDLGPLHDPHNPAAAPVGALIFFGPNSWNQGDGHVGISLGGGQMISANEPNALIHGIVLDYPLPNIQSSSYWNNLYRGWAWPPASWGPLAQEAAASGGQAQTPPNQQSAAPPPGGLQGGPSNLQGSDPNLQGSSPNLQGSTSPVQGSTGQVQGSPAGGGGGVPAPTVSLAQGPAAPAGYRYAVTLTGFPPGLPVSVECFDSASPGGFYSFTLTPNSAGTASTASQCYSGDGPDHWVVAGNLSSNHVTWGRAAPPPAPTPAQQTAPPQTTPQQTAPQQPVPQQTAPPQTTPPRTTAPTWAETVGGNANTWSDYNNAGGTHGPTILNGTTVQIACKVTGFRVADGNTWWYRIAASPWNGNFYVSADAFYNNGQTSGSLHGTPWVDPSVVNC